VCVCVWRVCVCVTCVCVCDVCVCVCLRLTFFWGSTSLSRYDSFPFFFSSCRRCSSSHYPWEGILHSCFVYGGKHMIWECYSTCVMCDVCVFEYILGGHLLVEVWFAVVFFSHPVKYVLAHITVHMLFSTLCFVYTKNHVWIVCVLEAYDDLGVQSLVQKYKLFWLLSSFCRTCSRSHHSTQVFFELLFSIHKKSFENTTLRVWHVFFWGLW